jgi:hypothetical protein
MIIGMEALALIIGIPLVYTLARHMAGQYGWVAALRPYVWFHLVLFLLLRPPPSLYYSILLVLSAYSSRIYVAMSLPESLEKTSYLRLNTVLYTI